MKTKFRVISTFPDQFIVQKKGLFGWKDIESTYTSELQERRRKIEEKKDKKIFTQKIFAESEEL